MFSGCLIASMSDEMESRARQILIRMFVPTVVAGIWTYAHLESVRARQFVSMWKEGGAVRVGNPYTASIPPRPKIQPAADEEPGDTEIEGVATTQGDF
jgi:hypothetical protein